jgi:exodeoxyribonuclease-3
VSLRLLSYNIRFGGGGREHLLASVINACDADLVILQEAVRPDIVERLAAACGMKTWGAVRGYSLAYMSRRDLSHHVWHRVALAKRRYLELALAGSDLRLFGVHLSAIHSNVTELRRSWELASLLRGIRAHQQGPHVVTGDFNTLAPGEELDMARLPPRLRAILWMTGRKIRWRVIRLMLESGYADGYRALQKEGGYTFPTWDPHIRLDYAFLPTAFASRLKRCEVIQDVAGAREASDHFPLLSEIED